MSETPGAAPARATSAAHCGRLADGSIEALIEHTGVVYGALHALHNNVGGTDASRDTSVVGME